MVNRLKLGIFLVFIFFLLVQVLSQGQPSHNVAYKSLKAYPPFNKERHAGLQKQLNRANANENSS